MLTTCTCIDSKKNATLALLIALFEPSKIAPIGEDEKLHVAERYCKFALLYKIALATLTNENGYDEKRRRSSGCKKSLTVRRVVLETSA